MKRIVFVIVVLFSLIDAARGASTDMEKITQEELVRRAEELLQGVLAGNNSAWQKYIAEDCLYFDEKGRSFDKAALMKEVGPLPEGYRVTFAVQNPKSVILPDTAVVSYDIDEDLWIFGQKMGATFHNTDTWVRRNGKWQILAIQVFRYYGDPAPGEVDRTKFAQYEGTYELAPGQRAKIFVEEGNLYYQRDGRDKEQLLPEAPDIFFRKGVEGRMLFRFNKERKVVELISRRNHEDIVWKKM